MPAASRGESGGRTLWGLPARDPGELGLDPMPLEQLKGELRGMVEAGRFPGFVCAVAAMDSSIPTWQRQACVVLAESFGLRDVDRREPVTMDTIWRQYSMTKAVVCVALMTFYDEGKVSLDDPVSKFLGDAWSKERLKIASSDGILKGALGEPRPLQEVRDGDTIYLFDADMTGNHLDVDTTGACRFRWRDNGLWQALKFTAEPSDECHLVFSIRAHTGCFLDVEAEDIRGLAAHRGVKASSTTPVAWAWEPLPATGPSRCLVVGTSGRLRHLASGRFLSMVDETDGARRFAVAVADPCSASCTFLVEKQCWSIGETQPCKREMKILHLLTHTSGLSYAGTDEQSSSPLDASYRPLVERCDRSEVRSIEDWVEEVSRLPLAYHPGDRWEYGYSIDVLGRVCEVLSGEKSLEIVLQERVLQPLKMNNTSFAAPSSCAANSLAALYQMRPDPDNHKKLKMTLLDDPRDSDWVPPKGPHAVLAGGGGVATSKGGLLSTAEDYMRFTLMLIQGGELDGQRVLHEKTVELMTAHNHLPDALVTGEAANKDARGWNLLGALQIPHPRFESDVGHFNGNYYWGGWASTHFCVSPATGTVIVFMANCVNDGPPEQLLAQRVGEAVRGRWGCWRWRLSLTLRRRVRLVCGREVERLLFNRRGCATVATVVLTTAAAAATFLTKRRKALH
eukprot:TRINITY_DN44909_c0_g1_i1.p1 TRINITY_DN44909_c0_g1~~TRINITY_DN44909_c0_g1_i1.p1  ORF type:complete len:680 (-),score=65.41 TRINITY_DN44909_c0_g1_i1:235-2274(-)